MPERPPMRLIDELLSKKIGLTYSPFYEDWVGRPLLNVFRDGVGGRRTRSYLEFSVFKLWHGKWSSLAFKCCWPVLDQPTGMKNWTTLFKEMFWSFSSYSNSFQSKSSHQRNSYAKMHFKIWHNDLLWMGATHHVVLTLKSIPLCEVITANPSDLRIV